MQSESGTAPLANLEVQIIFYDTLKHETLTDSSWVCCALTVPSAPCPHWSFSCVPVLLVVWHQRILWVLTSSIVVLLYCLRQQAQGATNLDLVRFRRPVTVVEIRIIPHAFILELSNLKLTGSVPFSLSHLVSLQSFRFLIYILYSQRQKIAPPPPPLYPSVERCFFM